jgi:hypothetical protein
MYPFKAARTPVYTFDPGPDEYTKTLGLEWNASIHHFRLSVAELPPLQDVTKRVLVSDIADI